MPKILIILTACLTLFTATHSFATNAYENMTTPRESQIEECPQEQIKLSRAGIFFTVAGLAAACAGYYLHSNCLAEDNDSVNCDEELGSNIKSGGYLVAGGAAAFTVLRYCGKKSGCYKSRSHMTANEISRAQMHAQGNSSGLEAFFGV